MTIFDIFQFDKEELKQFNVHFAKGTHNSSDGLFAYFSNKFKEWQEHEIDDSFNKPFIMSLLPYGDNEWLFEGFYKINNQYTFSNEKYCETVLLERNIILSGKLVLRYCKKQQKKIVPLHKCIKFFDLSEIRKDKYHCKPFSSFQYLNINYDFLCFIVKTKNVSWRNALSRAKGIYLISDLKTGRFYVGSAYGEVTFWDRWVAYEQSGHGGSRLLKKMIELNNKSYSQNFQFSFLEVTDIFTSNEEILLKESYWKEILMAQLHGYNAS